MKYFWTILCSILLSISCGRDADRQRELLSAPQGPVEYAQDIVMEYSDSSIVRVRLHAHRMERTTQDGEEMTLFPEGVYIEFFSDQGHPRSWMKARKAIQDHTSQQVIARDHVVLYNAQGDTLITNELIWDEKAEELYTPKFVKMKRPGHKHIYGYSFRAAQDFEIYTMRGVEGDFQGELSESE